MKLLFRPACAAVVGLLALGASLAHAEVRITEVAPWSSGNSPVAADWFELTNTGATTVSIAGWKVDDNSNSFGAAVALRGISSIAPGQSVIFVEGTANGSGDATLDANFLQDWFGAHAPAGLAVGNYGGSGIGLSTSGDAVNIYDAGGALQARVSFGASDAVSPFQTFDNAAGANDVVLAALSTVGVHGAFLAASSAIEIGSPGAVPEPQTIALMLAGLGLVGAVARKRRS
jgi:hypothetical protein